MILQGSAYGTEAAYNGLRLAGNLTKRDGVDGIERDVARLQALRAHASTRGVRSFGETRWVRMADPEHNEFCVCAGVES